MIKNGLPNMDAHLNVTPEASTALSQGLVSAVCASFFFLGLPQPLCPYPHHPLRGISAVSSHLRNPVALSLAVRWPGSPSR